MAPKRTVYSYYTPEEVKNIAIYIAGIAFYKFGLEAWNGSITTLAAGQFNNEDRYAMVGGLTGLYLAMQCFGGILVTSLIRKWSTRTVLVVAIGSFAIISTLLLIIDATRGGHFRPPGYTGSVGRCSSGSDTSVVTSTDRLVRRQSPGAGSPNSGESNDYKPSYYGNYSPVAIYLVYGSSGIVYGIVEIIRRVIPRDIVGGEVIRLRRMDAVVHIFYEISGTAAAFASSSLVGRLGSNYSFMISPIFFALAGVSWWFINLSSPSGSKDSVSDDLNNEDSSSVRSGWFKSLSAGFRMFARSVKYGATLTVSQIRFVWLIPAYALALYGHRYLENNLALIFARNKLEQESYYQIIVTGSNLGELVGAVIVFLTTRLIPTPIPFLRIHALLLLLVWVIPFFPVVSGGSTDAWRMAALFLPISMGWAAGDLSLSAYIQSSLDRSEAAGGLSPLGAVMSFLYSTYIATYAVLSPTLGMYVDNSCDLEKSRDHVKETLISVGGIQYTILCGVILIATFIPPGSRAVNPPDLKDTSAPDNGRPYPVDEEAEQTLPLNRDLVVKRTEADVVPQNGGWNGSATDAYAAPIPYQHYHAAVPPGGLASPPLPPPVAATPPTQLQPHSYPPAQYSTYIQDDSFALPPAWTPVAASHPTGPRPLPRPGSSPSSSTHNSPTPFQNIATHVSPMNVSESAPAYAPSASSESGYPREKQLPAFYSS